mmetsp:Transcript_36267/g.90275  ORF Transcript_36267/g.90275 Transcript_36267/m.90275 type:complete len:87 (-) Transcript_36267:237-497(-)
MDTCDVEVIADAEGQSACDPSTPRASWRAQPGSRIFSGDLALGAPTVDFWGWARTEPTFEPPSRAEPISLAAALLSLSDLPASDFS